MFGWSWVIILEKGRTYLIGDVAFFLEKSVKLKVVMRKVLWYESAQLLCAPNQMVFSLTFSQLSQMSSEIFLTCRQQNLMYVYIPRNLTFYKTQTHFSNQTSRLIGVSKKRAFVASMFNLQISTFLAAFDSFFSRPDVWKLLS